MVGGVIVQTPRTTRSLLSASASERANNNYMGGEASLNSHRQKVWTSLESRKDSKSPSPESNERLSICPPYQVQGRPDQLPDQQLQHGD